MRIKQDYLRKINKSNQIKAALIAENDSHPGTIQRWIDTNHEKLTTAKNLYIICSMLGVEQDELLETETAA